MIPWHIFWIWYCPGREDRAGQPRPACDMIGPWEKRAAGLKSRPGNEEIQMVTDHWRWTCHPGPSPAWSPPASRPYVSQSLPVWRDSPPESSLSPAVPWNKPDCGPCQTPPYGAAHGIRGTWMADPPPDSCFLTVYPGRRRRGISHISPMKTWTAIWRFPFRCRRRQWNIIPGIRKYPSKSVSACLPPLQSW